MKFENDYFRVIIEKKQLTEEQKKAHQARRKKKIPYVLTALVLVAAIVTGILYGHLHNAGKVEMQAAAEGIAENDANITESQINIKPEEEKAETESSYVTATELAFGIQKKYKNFYDYTYGEPIEDLGRGEAIEIALGYDPKELGEEYWYNIYGIFQDPDLTQRVIPEYSYDEDSQTLIMTPPNYSINRINVGKLDVEEVNRYDHSTSILFDKGAGADWGNSGILYMACYYDARTGRALAQPEVSIITVKGELQETPKLRYSILDDGRPQFSWTAVEGAEEYIICETAYQPEKGYNASMIGLDITSDTTWTTKAPEYGAYSTANAEFRTFILSEDQWRDESSYEFYKEKYEPYQAAQKDTTFGEPGICVIAVSGEGTSMCSNVFLYSEMAPSLPYSVAFNTEKENGFSSQYEAVKEIPAYDYVVMCDGIINRRVIDYQTQKASVTEKRFINVDGNGEYAGGENVTCLELPYIVEGTPFSSTMEILYYDDANLEKDLKFIEDREEKIRGKSGDLNPGTDIELSGEEAVDTEIIQAEDVKIFANSALSEYLAVSMLSGASCIDLSEFPEAKDTSFVEDALMEAYYQNPLILGIKGYHVNRKGTAVRVIYDETAMEQAEKQEKIKEKVKEVISQIIVDGMTDEEKELAINQYLCETIVYDEDALENAQENDFVYIDEKFNDSFTAYGALLNGKCVCAGYAAAFKLLSDEAGLESIVVTGFLDGNLSHAWNKVKIDGEWQIVDATNNDNEYFANALFNLPSYVGSRVLAENKEFMLDKLIPDYEGESEEHEYYHIMDSYFPIREIAEKLAEDLAENGRTTLRTDYDLNDEQFYQIAYAIYDIMGDDIDLYGYHWLGVIYLSTEAQD